MLRKKMINAVITAIMVLTLLSVCAFAKADDHTCSYLNGFCTSCDAYEPAVMNEDYYEITNAGQLYWFAEQVNSGNNAINGKLMANIVVNENVLNADGTLNGDGSNFREWVPIGRYEDWDKYIRYIGSFDGNNMTISGLYYMYVVDTEYEYVLESYVGVFGIAEDDGASQTLIQNLGVIDSYFYAACDVGGIVGALTKQARSEENVIASVVLPVGLGMVLLRIVTMQDILFLTVATIPAELLGLITLRQWSKIA